MWRQQPPSHRTGHRLLFRVLLLSLLGLWLSDRALAQEDDDRAEALSEHIHSTYRIPAGEAREIVEAALDTAEDHELDPELILAIIAVESSYRHDAVSHKGARGLMQIMPHAHPEEVRDIGGQRALFDPEKNITTGSRVLSKYLASSDGDLVKALRRYNGVRPGRASRYPDKVLRHYDELRGLVS